MQAKAHEKQLDYMLDILEDEQLLVFRDRMVAEEKQDEQQEVQLCLPRGNQECWLASSAPLKHIWLEEGFRPLRRAHLSRMCKIRTMLPMSRAGENPVSASILNQTLNH